MTNSRPITNASTCSALMRALRFASEKHKNQHRRDDTTPFINHIIGVVDNIVNIGGIEQENVIVAAALHDTIEDTETTREELLAIFGESITCLVEEVTDDKFLEKLERKRLQIAHASKKTPEAAIIKLADFTYNVCDLVNSPPNGWSKDRIAEYLEWSSEVVKNLQNTNTSLEAEFYRSVEKVKATL